MGYLALGAILISFAPIFIKATHGLEPSMIGFYRCLFAAMMMTPWALLQSRSARTAGSSLSSKTHKNHVRSKLNENDKKIILYLVYAGIFFAFDLSAWNRSVVYAGAGLGTLLGNTQAIYLGLIGVFWDKEKTGLTPLLMLVLAFVGVYLLVGVGEGAWNEDLYRRGIFYGLTTGFFYAGYIMCTRLVEMTKSRFTAVQRITMMSYFTAFFLLILAFVGGENVMAPVSLNDLFWVLMMSIFAQIMGWMLIGKALPTVPLSLSGLILLLQPISSLIMGHLLFAEMLTPKQVCGTILTLIAIYWAGRFQKNNNHKNKNKTKSHEHKLASDISPTKI